MFLRSIPNVRAVSGTLREESVCGRKNCGIYYCDRVGPQKNREKLEFIIAIWTNMWEIKEFITAMEYLR